MLMRIRSVSISIGGHDQLPARALYSPRETQHILSISHAQLYRLLGEKRLAAVKIGVRTYVTAPSLETFLATLPPARIGAA